MYNSSSLYGNYRTRTFAEIFSDYDDDVYNSSAAYFSQMWNDSPFSSALQVNNLAPATALDPTLTFYLLYAKYGNSHIAYSDENQFLYQIHSIMFQYGPTWAKELDIQKQIRELSLAELREGSRSITNLAENPSIAPSTQNTEELPYVNSQNVSKTTRSIADGVALLQALLQKDVTEEFTNKFKKLFLTVVAPECPLWYATTAEEEEDLNP